MSINKICPRCGSNKVELTHINKGYGCLFGIIFGFFYLILIVLIKWMIGLTILLVWDWWFAIVMKSSNKPYTWISKRFFFRRNTYYCHECGNNFKA